jgi:hypothetical protein
MDFSSYGAHADMLGARFGMRAAEDGHLTLLRAHAAVAHVGCCCCHPPNACKCHRGLQGPCADYLQDRALIKQNLGPTVSQNKRPPSGNIKNSRRATVKAKAFYGTLESLLTVELLSLDVTDRLGPIIKKTIETVSDKNLIGATVRSTALNLKTL